jgi:DNA-cytosine methyltransferase
MNRNALSLFSGAGGDSCGLEKAGWKVTHYSEFNNPAIKTHGVAFPNSQLLQGPNNSNDIKTIPDATFEELRGKIDLIFAGFPCFVKDTLVLTNHGYKPIQDVSLEDSLQTHTGKFQKPLNLQRKIYNGALYDLKLKYHPEVITCTEEHPFYIREKKQSWNNSSRKYEYTFGEPKWKNASDLTMNDYYGMVINSNDIIPEFTFIKKINKTKTEEVSITLDTKEQWFMMGYFIGDGWIEETKKVNGNSSHKIRFAFHEDDTNIIERIKTVLPITYKKVKSGRSVKYGCANFIWFNILKQFGKYAHGKLIPEWVQDAPKNLIQEFINGYLAADGCANANTHKFTTVSYNLAYGLQRMYLKLGHIVSINKTTRPKTCIIEGRTVNQRNTYQIQYNLNNNNRYSSFIDGNYVWYAPFKITSREIENEPVYNFEVETDNSYIVYNTIVHNCQGFSHAGKKKTDDPRNELVHEFVRAARIIHPTWIIGENVKGLLSRKGVYPKNTKSRPIIDIISELFDSIGYKITYRVVDATEVGVPQLRKRLIIVGHKGAEYPHIPWNQLPTPSTKPTIRHMLATTLQGAMELPSMYKPSEHMRFMISTKETTPSGTPHPNLVRLVGGIRNLSSKEKEEMNIDKKEKVVHTEKDGLISFGVRKSGYHGQILDPDGPSKTIICTYNLCPRLFVGLHNPKLNKFWIRCLTPQECGQIQGFEAKYPWQGTDKEKIIQIGNAVPPPLATAVANLLEKTTFSTTPQTVINTNDSSDSEEEED